MKTRVPVLLVSLVLASTATACQRDAPLPRIDLAARMRPEGAARGVVGAEGVAAFGRLAPAQLERLRQARMFFGHQSVGRNLLDGAQALGLGFQEVGRGADFAPGRRGEAAVADNRDPLRKVRSFLDLMEPEGIADAVDLAGFKFCWIDFDTGTDTDALGQRYDAAVRGLQARHPRLRLFHVTPPLTTDEPDENRVRVRFGAALRQRYASRAVVFDLAEVQSTRDDGTRCARRGVPALCEAYASDNGHLSEAGSERAARAFLVALAVALEPG